MVQQQILIEHQTIIQKVKKMFCIEQSEKYDF
jgi:hypothetical protein